MATSKTAAAIAKKPATTRAKTATKTATVKKAAPSGKVTAKTITAKKPATSVAKTAAKPANKAAAPKTAVPAAARKAAPRKVSPAVTAEERYRMIQDAAYYLAEKNDFRGGAMGYWIAAEMEIDEFLSGK